MHIIEAKSILSNKNGMNIYRGCLHGCIYCDSRSTCYQMKHDFEDVEVKINAPELLEMALKKKKQRTMVGMGAMSDPYNPLEKNLNLTRKCLEVIYKYRFGATLITKSDLVLRDLDLFREINRKTKAVLQMTLTCADDKLCRIIEPNVAVTSKRLEVLKTFKENGIPTVVWLTPLLPYITDSKENIMSLVKMCADAGVYGILSFKLGLTLREGDREYYYQKLDEFFPGLKEIYIKEYGDNYILPIRNQYRLYRIFLEECAKYGIVTNEEEIFSYLNTFEDKNPISQLTLF